MDKLTGWVGLEKLKIHANHGVYKSEKENGNIFLLDVYVKGDLKRVASSDDIEEAINYEIIAAVCKEEMSKPSNTLEHIGYRITNSLFNRLPISKVKLKISKTNPPIEEECSASVVSMTVRRNEI